MSKALSSLKRNKEDFTLDMELNPVDQHITKVLQVFPNEGLAAKPTFGGECHILVPQSREISVVYMTYNTETKMLKTNSL